MLWKLLTTCRSQNMASLRYHCHIVTLLQVIAIVTVTAAILFPLYRTMRVSQHPQLRELFWGDFLE